MKSDVRDHDQLLPTQTAAAAYAGVSRRTIRRWIHERNMPTVILDGKVYYAKSILDAFKRNNDNERPLDLSRKETAEAEFRETRTQLAKLELAIRQGKYIARDEMEEQNVRKVVVLRRTLVGLGRKLAPRLVGKKESAIRQMIDDEIKRAISKFAAS